MSERRRLDTTFSRFLFLLSHLLHIHSHSSIYSIHYVPLPTQTFPRGAVFTCERSLTHPTTFLGFSARSRSRSAARFSTCTLYTPRSLLLTIGPIAPLQLATAFTSVDGTMTYSNPVFGADRLLHPYIYIRSICLSNRQTCYSCSVSTGCTLPPTVCFPFSFLFLFLLAFQDTKTQHAENLTYNTLVT